MNALAHRLRRLEALQPEQRATRLGLLVPEVLTAEEWCAAATDWYERRTPPSLRWVSLWGPSA